MQQVRRITLSYATRSCTRTMQARDLVAPTRNRRSGPPFRPVHPCACAGTGWRTRDLAPGDGVKVEVSDGHLVTTLAGGEAR